MATFDPGTLKLILQSGAYGSGLLFFGYGAYVLTKAREPAQSRNVRWFLGLGAAVFLTLAGLDFAKALLATRPVAHRVFLTFAPTFADIDLPDPSVEYLGKRLPSGAPIVIQSDDSTIAISVQKIIEMVKKLRVEKSNLETAYGATVTAQLPEAFAEEVAAATPATGQPCSQSDAACGWAELSSGDLSAAKAAFEKTIASADSATPAPKEDVANALHGLGEIYVGQGEIDKANTMLTRASALGNDSATKRLRALSTTPAFEPASTPQH